MYAYIYIYIKDQALGWSKDPFGRCRIMVSPRAFETLKFKVEGGAGVADHESELNQQILGF